MVSYVQIGENSSYNSLNRDISRFSQQIVNDKELLEKIGKEISQLENKDRLSQSGKVLLRVLHEEASDEIEEISETMNNKPEWENRREFVNLLGWMKSRINEEINEARENLPHNVDEDYLIIDKLLESYVSSIEFLKNNIDDPIDEEGLDIAFNCTALILMRLIQISENQKIEVSEATADIVNISEELSKIGKEKAISSRILKEFYGKEYSYEEVIAELRKERAVIIYQETDISTSRAAEIAELKVQEFIELADENEAILKIGP